MQLNPGERLLLATFPSSTKAEKAVDKLKNAGIDTVQLDRVSRFGVENDSEINNPIAGRADTITGLTLYSANTNNLTDADRRTLIAADPSVSGMAGRGYGLAGGEGFLVSIVTNEKMVNTAVKVIEECGGEV